MSRADSPNAYVRRMLTNTFLSVQRSKARGLELLTDQPPEPARHLDEGADDDRWLLWPHVGVAVAAAGGVVLRYYEDLSEADIAETLGCSRGNVKSTAHRALKSLRAAIGSRDLHDQHDGKEG